MIYSTRGRRNRWCYERLLAVTKRILNPWTTLRQARSNLLWLRSGCNLGDEIKVDNTDSYEAIVQRMMQGPSAHNKGEVCLELHLFTQEISPVLDKQFSLLLWLYTKGRKLTNASFLFFLINQPRFRGTFHQERSSQQGIRQHIVAPHEIPGTLYIY